MKIIKVILLILVPVVALTIYGLKLPDLVPGCTCELTGGCHGCGEIVGNVIANFALLITIYGAMGLVLFLWFGIPIGIIGFIVWGIYKILTAKKQPEQFYSNEESNSPEQQNQNYY